MSDHQHVGDRATADLIVIFLAGVVGVVIFISTIGIVIGVLWDRDISLLATRVAAMVNTLVGALVGYVAGQRQERRRNGNGNGDTTPPE